MARGPQDELPVLHVPHRPSGYGCVCDNCFIVIPWNNAEHIFALTQMAMHQHLLERGPVLVQEGLDLVALDGREDDSKTGCHATPRIG